MSISTTHLLWEVRNSLVRQSPVEARPRVFSRDVIGGLSRTPREIPGKYVFDRRGAELYRLMCELPQFYPARAELAIVREFADRIVKHVGKRVTFIELGCAHPATTSVLLNYLDDSSVYVPIDGSPERLSAAADRIPQSLPHREVLPLHADIGSADIVELIERQLPPGAPTRRVVYLSAPTFGSLKSSEARQLLRSIVRLCGPDGRLLVSVDLDKSAEIVEAAYNDPAGVVAEFNLNLLLRINRELGGDFDLDAFEHDAVYNARERRLEMRLVSKWQQSPSVCGRQLSFAAGESITTHVCQLFPIDGFSRLAKGAGFTPEWCWFDERETMALMCLAVGR